MAKQKQELVEAPPPSRAVVTFAGRPVTHPGPARLIVPIGTAVGDWPASWDTRTEEGRVRLWNVFQGTDLNLDKATESVELDVEHVAAGWLDAREEERQGEAYNWLVLIAPDGKTFGTSSPVVAHAIASLAEVWPGFPNAKPMRVRIGWRTNRARTARYHFVQLVGSCPVNGEK